MEQRWLALARSYGFTERLSTFVEPFQREAREDRETASPGTARPICRRTMAMATCGGRRTKPCRKVLTAR
jgi:hypothetical protein